MSDPPPGDQAAGEPDARAIHIDHAKGMPAGDHGTQSNSSTHFTEAGRDSYVAGRDQYVFRPEARLCRCGKYAVGACQVCSFPVCSEHGTSLADVFLCNTHRQERQQANEVPQKQAASEHKARSPAADGSVPSRDPGAGTGGHRLQQGTRIAAVIVMVAAAVVGLIVLLPRIPLTSQAGTLASYSFAPQYGANGLVIQRDWTISQDGAATFTESITAANTTGSPITEMFAEPVPPVMTADLLSAHFSPKMPDILDLGHAIGWTLKIPAYGRVVLSYAVPIKDPEEAHIVQEVWANNFLAHEATVVNAAAALKILTIRQGNLSLILGSTKQLTLAGVLLNKETAPVSAFSSAIWKSADAKVAVVNSDGTITAVGLGSTTITAQVEAVTATAKVTVTRAGRLPGGGGGSRR
jgi:hypothetical protein